MILRYLVLGFLYVYAAILYADGSPLKEELSVRPFSHHSIPQLTSSDIDPLLIESFFSSSKHKVAQALNTHLIACLSGKFKIVKV